MVAPGQIAWVFLHIKAFVQFLPPPPSKQAPKKNPVDEHLLKLSLMVSLSKTNYKI